MKTTAITILLAIILGVGAACKAAGVAEPEDVTDETIPSHQAADEEMAAEPSESGCPEAASSSHQLIDAAREICFLYLDNYDVYEHSDSSGYTLYVRSLLNTGAPSASVHFESAGGRPLEEVTA